MPGPAAQPESGSELPPDPRALSAKDTKASPPLGSRVEITGHDGAGVMVMAKIIT